jgi:2-desacetyl-2-hydroxyethyl bacteriochlorophyllide A dehydrogenase
VKAVLIEQPGQVSLQTVPDPVLAPDEVIIKVAACGLCGTDVHLYQGKIHGAYPLIPGHEVSGTIIAVGPEVSGDWAVGQRVIFDPNLACGECEFCRRGLYNHCRAWAGVGITRSGGFAEYVAVPASVLYDLGQLAFAVGAFVEPLSCVAHGLNRAPARPGDNVLVFGAGPIGLLLMQAARAQGAERVVVTDVLPDRLAVAEQLGAVSVPADKEQDGRLRDLAPIGYDLVIDATGVPGVVEAALDYVRPAGQTLIFGVCPEDARIPLSPYDVYRRDLSIVGTFALNRTFPPALEWLSSGAVQVEPLLTHQVGLDELPDVLTGRRKMPGRLKVQMQVT